MVGHALVFVNYLGLCECYPHHGRRRRQWSHPPAQRYSEPFFYMAYNVRKVYKVNGVFCEEKDCIFRVTW